jgi:cardiolipin synthase
VLGEWYSLIVSVIAIWAVVLSIYIVSQRRAPSATISWILALSFLPLVGFAVYWAFGPRRFQRKKRKRVEAQEAMERTHNRRDDPKPEGREDAEFLITMNEGSLGTSAILREANFEFFFAGKDKYAHLLEDIQQAKHHINMEYYIWEPDQIGTRLRDALVERAKAGIEVRLHLDGVGASKANKRFWRPLSEAGGKVTHFNRLALRRRRGNFRTHRKIVVIDGRIAYNGGMNITDVHSSEFSGAEAWRDTHLRLEGPAACGLQMVFAEGWYDVADEVLEGETYFPPPTPVEEHCLFQVVSSGPDETRNTIHKLFAASVFAGKERIYLTTPYFVPDITTIDALSSAALRGADVRLLLPKKNDLKIIGAASRSYYPQLLRVGVRIFEYGPTMIHAKTLVVDKMVGVIGTANADYRSFRLNFEVVVASYNNSFCDQLAECFMNDLQSAEEVTLETIAGYSRARSLGQSFARLISPLL